MKIYLVGGAVRDELLGLPVKERDWVVVGSTPEDMLQKGYKPVGKDFPVFLHPKTKEEYALARTERKSGRGYHGFKFYTSRDVTLEEDLRRRDLTVNAIAKDSDGNIIDPFNGYSDIKAKRFRHVSEAFREDPLRLLRLARFCAHFHHLGFRVAKETQTFLQDIVKMGELSDLTQNRVWMEFEKALAGKNPEIFIKVLRYSGALEVLFPEIDALFGVPDPVEYHPEIDVGKHSLMALQMATKLTQEIDVRFAVLCHDLGKPVTPKDKWPHHHDHEELGAQIVKQFCKRLPVPRYIADLAYGVAKFHGLYHQVKILRSGTKLRCLEGLDLFRKPERLNKMLIACEADSRGRLHRENKDFSPKRELWLKIFNAAKDIDISAIPKEGITGKQIGEKIRQLRIDAIKKIE